MHLFLRKLVASLVLTFVLGGLKGVGHDTHQSVLPVKATFDTYVSATDGLRVALDRWRKAAEAAWYRAARHNQIVAWLKAVAHAKTVNTVIDFARSQIGKRYVYAGAGPNVWDCSGLTMVALDQVGIATPHQSISQYAQFPAVPLDALQPGDLVFFGHSPMTNHHVGLYVGNSLMIDAPHTGTVVNYHNIHSYGDLVAAARPIAA